MDVNIPTSFVRPCVGLHSLRYVLDIKYKKIHIFKPVTRLFVSSLIKLPVYPAAPWAHSSERSLWSWCLNLSLPCFDKLFLPPPLVLFCELRRGWVGDWLVGGGWNLVCLLFLIHCFRFGGVGGGLCLFWLVGGCFLKVFNHDHDQDTSYQFRKLSFVFRTIHVHQPISWWQHSSHHGWSSDSWK